jgi:hypothetical protein
VSGMISGMTRLAPIELRAWASRMNRSLYTRERDDAVSSEYYARRTTRVAYCADGIDVSVLVAPRVARRFSLGRAVRAVLLRKAPRARAEWSSSYCHAWFY